MSSNSVSALRLGSVIHSGGLFFYLATHRKRRVTSYLRLFGGRVIVFTNADAHVVTQQAWCQCC